MGKATEFGGDSLNRLQIWRGPRKPPPPHPPGLKRVNPLLNDVDVVVAVAVVVRLSSVIIRSFGICFYITCCSIHNNNVITPAAGRFIGSIHKNVSPTPKIYSWKIFAAFTSDINIYVFLYEKKRKQGNALSMTEMSNLSVTFR